MSSSSCTRRLNTAPETSNYPLYEHSKQVRIVNVGGPRYQVHRVKYNISVLLIVSGIIRTWYEIWSSINDSIAYFSLFCFHPIHYLRPYFPAPCSLLLIVGTQIRGHIVDSFPPFATAVRALHFCRDENSALSSLVDSGRLMPSHAIVGTLDTRQKIK